MVDNHFRWDFIGLSTDTKPTPATSSKVVDGSTFYCSDNSKLYVFCKDTWYEKTATGGASYTAGDGIVISEGTISADLAQTTGSSTTKIMSQDAVTQALASIGGSFKELTSADYNYDSDNDGVNDSLIIEKLPAGTYSLTPGVVYYNGEYQQTAIVNNRQWVINFGESQSEANKYVLGFICNTRISQCIFLFYTTYEGTGVPHADGQGLNTVLTRYDLADNLYTTSTGRYALDGHQGKVLKDLVDSLAIKNAGAPTTSTVGTVGQLLEDTTNGKLYICTAVTAGVDPDPTTYTWEEVGAGGGGSGVIELTTADYNYPVDNPTSIAFWLLPAGIYKIEQSSPLNVRYSIYATTTMNNQTFVLLKKPNSNITYGYWYDTDYNKPRFMFSKENSPLAGYTRIICESDIVDDLYSSGVTKSPLSANQGYILNGKITPATDSSAPTTSTVGEKGKIFIDTTNSDAYICVDDTGGTYTWKKITP